LLVERDREAMVKVNSKEDIVEVEDELLNKMAEKMNE
jgi:hypothetical protein